MHVLSLIHYPFFGGPHNCNLYLIPLLATRGVHTTVVLPDEPGNAVARLRDAGIEVITRPLHRPRKTYHLKPHVQFLGGFWRGVQTLRKLIRELEVDLVLINGLVNPLGAIAARLEGEVSVVWQIIDIQTPLFLRQVLMPLVTRLADVVMCTGKGVARVHRGALGLGERLVLFFPPVDTTLFQPDPSRRAKARAELGLAADEVVIGNVSNLLFIKGHHTFIRAAAALRRLHPKVRFVILGASHANHSGYAASLWRQALGLDLRLGKELIVCDPGSRVADLAQAFDLFWLTSEVEGLPTVVEEAMALALPVVSTDCGGVRELVCDGVTGFVTPSRNNPEAIARATLPLLREPDLCTRMGHEARRRAVEYFTVEGCAEAHMRAFETAIAHHSRI